MAWTSLSGLSLVSGLKMTAAIMNTYFKDNLNAIATWSTRTHSSGDFSAGVATWTVDSGDQRNFTYRIFGKTMAIMFGIGTTSLTSPATTVTIASSSVANPTTITTAASHGLSSGASVTISGHTGSTPSLNGTHTVSVIDATHFTIPVSVSVGGTGGTFSNPLGVVTELSILIPESKTAARELVVPCLITNSSWEEAGKMFVQPSVGTIGIRRTNGEWFTTPQTNTLSVSGYIEFEIN